MKRNYYLARRIDVADICSDTRSATNVVETERGDQRVTFEKQRQWLANSSSSAKDGDLGVTSRGRREKARRRRSQSTNCRAGEHGGRKRKRFWPKRRGINYLRFRSRPIYLPLLLAVTLTSSQSEPRRTRSAQGFPEVRRSKGID
jgi:hypothetical protein